MSRLCVESTPRRQGGENEPAAGRADNGSRGFARSVGRVEVVSAPSLPVRMTAAQPAPEPAYAVPIADAKEASVASVWLVRQALEGNSGAFGELIERHERAALAVAYSATRDASLAADAVQEACLKAWHKRHSLADPERFAGWLLHIVRRCALDQLRGRKPVHALSGTEDVGATGEPGDAASRLMRQETDERVRQALEEL